VPDCYTINRERRRAKSGNYLAGALFALLFCLAPAHRAWAIDEISSFAFVQEDGSMKVDQYLVHLYGIYIPPTDHTCYTFTRPVQCGTRASLALDFKISGSFVYCTQRATNTDDSIVASCRVGNQDLSEWMLQNGWAVALPDAPFEYSALERIAQSRGIGIWGIPVDVIRKR
jgi:endonuclease YncB( thermonuclease family)